MLVTLDDRIASLRLAIIVANITTTAQETLLRMLRRAECAVDEATKLDIVTRAHTIFSLMTPSVIG